MTIQSAKNSVLPVLAATILTGGTVELRRCPHLRDVEASIRILQALGCRAEWQGDTLTVDTSGMSGCGIPDALMREMRSSVIFLGAILARCGQASLSSPGGCELGPRPIDLHLSGLRMLGAEIDDTGGTLCCQAGKLTGREIVLGFPSVGATENLMLAACGAEGVTVLSNAAREPEIEDLQNFLNTCGGEVAGGGTSTVVIRGGRPLHGGTYTVIPDRIAAATYLCAAASAGATFSCGGAGGTPVHRDGGTPRGGLPDFRGQRRDCLPVQRTSARARPCPNSALSRLPHRRAGRSDGGAAAVPGAAVFEENLFSSRYRHVDELTRMGADIRTSGRTAVVLGVERLHGAAVRCTDLRGGAALCVAALAADGETVISEITHIDRGYEHIERDLAALGADIRRTETAAA